MKIKNKKKLENKKNNQFKLPIIVKFFLILLIIYLFTISNTLKQNSIELLAVSVDSEDNIIDSSTIGLNLKMKKGTGKIFFNSNSIIDTDTQLSIKNSQKITCLSFNLDCSKYDFYFSFEDGGNLILKGPSASLSIANLVFKTYNSQKVDNSIVFTGNLLYGGVVSAVGGIDEKIEVAQKNNYSKIYIPYTNVYNKSKNYSIEIVKIFNVLETNNLFNENLVEDFKSDRFEKEIKSLSDYLCDRENLIVDEVNFNFLSDKENTTYTQYLESKNSSNQNVDEYSRGSFCFSKNINLRTIYESQKYSEKEFFEKVDKLKEEISQKNKVLLNENYKNKITSKNNLNIYLLLNDRLAQSKDLLESINLTSNETYDNIYRYSYALERFYTVELWENLILEKKSDFTLSQRDIENSCDEIISQIKLKIETSQDFFKTFFSDSLEDLNSLREENPYLCLYRGIETNAKIDMSLNTIEINDTQKQFYSKNLNNVAKNLLLKYSNKEEYSIIPYIYIKYSNDLLSLNSTENSIYYSNLAISFSHIDLFFQKENNYKTFFETYFRAEYMFLFLLPFLLF